MVAFRLIPDIRASEANVCFKSLDLLRNSENVRAGIVGAALTPTEKLGTVLARERMSGGTTFKIVCGFTRWDSFSGIYVYKGGYGFFIASC
jgi:hypothetical protein